jgi:hypothetical protein
MNPSTTNTAPASISQCGYSIADGSARHFAFASSACPPNVASPRLSLTGAFNVKGHAASGNVSIHLAQAKIRFNPDLDPMTVYRSYGISGPDEE